MYMKYLSQSVQRMRPQNGFDVFRHDTNAFECVSRLFPLLSFWFYFLPWGHESLCSPFCYSTSPWLILAERLSRTKRSAPCDVNIKTNKAAGWLRGGWHARRTWTKWHAFILSLLQCYMLHWSRCNNDKSPHNSARLLGRIAIDDIFNRIDLNLFMGFFSHYNTLYCYYLWWDMIWCKTCEHQHKSFIEIYWSRKYRIYECLLVQTSWWTHK